MIIRYDWQNIHNDLSEPVVRSINNLPGGLSVHPLTAELKYSPLPFYNKTVLLEVNDPARPAGSCPCWFLLNNNTVRHLNGDSAPIHAANDEEKIRVTSDNVLPYLDFFCYFLHGSEGPFFIVDDLCHPAFDFEKMDDALKAAVEKAVTPPELEILECGDFYARMPVLYGNKLFLTIFSITYDGIVDMLDDKPLIDDIPVNKIKPGY